MLHFTWNSLWGLKEAFLQEYTFMAIYCQEIIIFEFQLVLFVFSLVLGDPFMVSPPTPLLKRGRHFSKKYFSWGTDFVGKIYKGVVLHGETNDQIIPRGRRLTNQ